MQGLGTCEDLGAGETNSSAPRSPRQPPPSIPRPGCHGEGERGRPLLPLPCFLLNKQEVQDVRVGGGQSPRAVAGSPLVLQGTGAVLLTLVYTWEPLGSS